EKAGGEKEKAEAEKEKAGGEKEKAGPEKTEVQRNGKKEVAFETLELSEKEAGGIKKPESPWVRHTLSPFHKDSGPSLPGDRGIGSHRSNNRQSSK
ncbi:MAG: hypothetical protein LIP16_20490, partial [Clostridium sp.]|nr:hypothetical protein [Clostridium sp.]